MLKKNVERKSEEHDHETEKCLSDAVSIILYIILLEACISFTRTVMMTNTKKIVKASFVLSHLDEEEEAFS